MAKTPVEHYREHAVWEVMTLKREALETARFSYGEYERWRNTVIALLAFASESRRNPQAYAYDDVLDDLNTWANGLAADEAGFSDHLQRRGGPDGLAAIVRQLPGRPAKNFPGSYVDVINSAADARQVELAELRQDVVSLQSELLSVKEALAGARSSASSAEERAEEAAAAAGRSAEATEKELRITWGQRITEWDSERYETDEKFVADMAVHLQMLAHAARLGERLLENATATLVAKDWGQRASRERRAGNLTRWLGIASLAVAVVVGAIVISRAIEDGFDLTLGDGVLRASLILAIASIGAALLAESRRHFREADSAEEVKLSLVAIEPFFASDDGQRQAARQALGDAVFVRNVLSRFSHRDASKHASVSEVSISGVVDELTKAADLAKKANGTGT